MNVVLMRSKISKNLLKSFVHGLLPRRIEVFSITGLDCETGRANSLNVLGFLTLLSAFWSVQRSAKVDAPGCVNAAGKLGPGLADLCSMGFTYFALLHLRLG